jgi:hypothetical protein
MKMVIMDTVLNSIARFGIILISHMSVGVPITQLIQANGINSILDNYTVKRYTYNMNTKEIATLLDQESYRIWDTTKIIKNQDYHDGLVKGLKMASKLVAKL